MMFLTGNKALDAWEITLLILAIIVLFGIIIGFPLIIIKGLKEEEKFQNDKKNTQMLDGSN